LTATFIQAPTPIIVGGVTSTTISFASNVVLGNLLFCFCRAPPLTGPGITVTDNLGDGVPWVQFGNYWGNNTPADKGVFMKIAGASGPCTVTITGNGGAAGTIRAVLREYSGIVDPINAISVYTNIAGATNQYQLMKRQVRPGSLVIAGGAAPTNTTLAAGASGPNSNFVKLDANANGLIGCSDSVNWPGGIVEALFTTGTTATFDSFIVAMLEMPNDYTSYPKSMMRPS
jgi:hypothetical protein